MKNLTLILAMLVIFASCTNNGLDKSIIEPLTDDELYANMKKDSSFTDLYNVVGVIRQLLTADQSLSVKYRDITYQDVIDFQNINLDRDKVDAEHARQYANRDNLRNGADSIFRHYMSVQPDSLVKINFCGKSIRNSYYTKSTVLSFEIIPLKGPIDDLNFSYIFALKDENYNDYSDVPYNSLKGHIFSLYPIKKKKIERDELYSIPEKFKGLSFEDLSKKYRVFYDISNVTYQGKNWRDVPFYISSVIDNWETTSELWNEDHFIKDNLLDRIIQDYFSITYKPFSDYYSEKLQEIQKQSNPLLYELMEGVRMLSSLSTLFN